MTGAISKIGYLGHRERGVGGNTRSFTVHRAFGLSFAADFPLQGLVADGHGPVDVRIFLCAPREVEAAWAGRRTDTSWRSVFGDGETFSGRRAQDGSWHLTYGQQAVFYVSADAGTVLCGPEHPQDLAWRRVLLDAVLMVASVARGFEVLHAGAVQTPAGVVAVVAESGGGKSSLVAELVRRGRQFFCDDILVFDHGSNGVLAYPGPPVLNLPLAPHTVPVAQIGSLLARFGDEAWVAIDGAASRECAVAAVCLLERGPQLTTQASRLAPSPLHLRPHVRPVHVAPARERRRFEMLADLAETVPVHRVCAGPEATPAGIADMVEECLDRDGEECRGRG